MIRKRIPSRRQLSALSLATALILGDRRAEAASIMANVSGTIPTGGGQICVWNVPGGGSWGTATNWLNDIIPQQPGDTAEFASAIHAASTVSLNANWTVASVIFNNTNSYTLSAGTVSGVAR